jgi:hypothetical protein
MDLVTTPKEVTSMWLLSVAAIVLGLIAAIADADLFMAPLSWFVLAIAIAVLNPGPLPFARRRT